MTADVQSKVYEWIDQQADGAEPALVRLQLVHLNAAEQHQPLASYRLEGAELGDIKGNLWQTAKHVVGAWAQGPQRFAVRAFFAGEESSGAYLPFLLAGEPEASSAEPGSTEPANLVGLLKQLMRHTEAQQRTIQVMSLDALTFQQRALRTAQASEEAMRGRYYEMLERGQQSLVDAEDRALARDLVLRGEARKDQLAERAMSALPLLANQVSKKLGGPRIFQNPETAEHMMLADMVESLDDQRFELLMAAFPNPAHQAYLLQLVKEKIEARNAKQEAEPDGPNTDPARH